MEIVDLYNDKKEKINKTWERQNTKEPPQGEYKLNVHVWLINDNNELLIQKRGKTLKRHPNKWNFTGGAVDQNETSLEGATRELQEELGINIENLEFLLSFKREHDFVDVWIGKTNININDLKPSKREVQEIKWVTIQELKDLINKNEFVPSIKLYYSLFENLLNKCYINNKKNDR